MLLKSFLANLNIKNSPLRLILMPSYWKYVYVYTDKIRYLLAFESCSYAFKLVLFVHFKELVVWWFRCFKYQNSYFCLTILNILTNILNNVFGFPFWKLTHILGFVYNNSEKRKCLQPEYFSKNIIWLIGLMFIMLFICAPFVIIVLHYFKVYII